MMWIKLGRKIKKKGGLLRLHTNNIKQAISLSAFPLHDKAYEDSKKLVLKFLVKNASMLELKEKGHILRKRLKFLSKKFKDAHVQRIEKFNILKENWNHLCKKLDEFSRGPNGNAKMKQMVKDLVFTIPRDVRDCVLKEYLKRCHIKYCLAFYQWRYMYEPDEHSDPNKSHKYSKEQIKENFEGSYAYLKRNIDIARKPS